MKLKSIQLTEYENQPEQWRLEDCTLSDMNLIVGKNATGKTRTLNAIATLTRLLAGELKIMDSTGNFTVIFDHNGVDMNYRLRFADHEVIEEALWQGDKLLLQREKAKPGKILTEQLDKPGDYLAFQPPPNEIAVVSRRDAIQHPFLEQLYQWGKSANYFQFGTSMGQDQLTAFDLAKLNLKEANQVVALFKKGQENDRNYVPRLIEDMRFCGYELEHIALQTLVNFSENRTLVNGIQIKEKDLEIITPHLQMSSGLFRILSLLIQLNYAIQAHLPSCILIDDIGEGLDYTRSTALISLLMNKVKGTQMQLILSTNDQFVMDAMPLKYWSIIKRSPGFAKMYNYLNCKKLFDRFQFTGLGNFDFFSSNYYLKEG
jgi:energy-coupling factor transporter ATP-binding protein EcfA2